MAEGIDIDINESFGNLSLTDNENSSGWGPPINSNFTFKDVPYEPIKKGEVISKVCDWTGALNRTRYSDRYAGGPYQNAHDDDENAFILIDTTKVSRPAYLRRGRFQQNRLRQIRAQQQSIQKNILGQLKVTKSLKNLERERERQIQKLRKQFGSKFEQKNLQNQIKRESTIKIKSDWIVIEEVGFSRLLKLNLSVDNPVDLKQCGWLEYYDKRYDRITTRNEKKLIMTNRVLLKTSTTDDPVIRELCHREGDVFITDSILTILMCCPRSVYPWDIVVNKIEGKIFFDKRDDCDVITVSETSADPPNDKEPSINAPKSLAMEATLINANFTQQVLRSDEERYQFEFPNPFSTEKDSMASVAYRYREWNLGNDIKIVVRCELDGALQVNGTTKFLNIKALNEWDSRLSNGIDWKSKLDTQRGAVLATELKNNGFKLARWTASSILSGADQLKFGFVSRVHPKDPLHHVIRGMQQYSPIEFARQMNLNMENGWGIVRWLVDLLMKQESGKYIIVKDPMKSVMRIYKVPNDNIEDHDDNASADNR